LIIWADCQERTSRKGYPTVRTRVTVDKKHKGMKNESLFEEADAKNFCFLLHNKNDLYKTRSKGNDGEGDVVFITRHLSFTHPLKLRGYEEE